jgi:hypothetical protein
MLEHVAHRVMTHELATSQTPGELALASVGVYAKLLVHLSSILGEAGSHALFRSSLRLTTFPFLNEIRAQEPPALLKALNTALQKHEPDVVVEVSIALLTAFIELLATFVGERLTCELLHDVWPTVITVQSQEMPK